MALALVSLGVTIVFAKRLGELYDLESAGWITPVHLTLAKLTTAAYLLPITTGILTLRNRRHKRLHFRCAMAVLAMTLRHHGPRAVDDPRGRAPRLTDQMPRMRCTSQGRAIRHAVGEERDEREQQPGALARRVKKPSTSPGTANRQAAAKTAPKLGTCSGASSRPTTTAPQTPIASVARVIDHIHVRCRPRVMRWIG